MHEQRTAEKQQDAGILGFRALGFGCLDLSLRVKDVAFRFHATNLFMGSKCVTWAADNCETLSLVVGDRD